MLAAVFLTDDTPYIYNGIKTFQRNEPKHSPAAWNKPTECCEKTKFSLLFTVYSVLGKHGKKIVCLPLNKKKIKSN